MIEKSSTYQKGRKKKLRTNNEFSSRDKSARSYRLLFFLFKLFSFGGHKYGAIVLLDSDLKEFKKNFVNFEALEKEIPTCCYCYCESSSRINSFSPRQISESIGSIHRYLSFILSRPVALTIHLRCLGVIRASSFRRLQIDAPCWTQFQESRQL